MSDELKPTSCQQTDVEPSATDSTVPVWLVVVMLVLLFLGAVYFDRHSGWFDKQVYSPYANAAMLESYQPKSGAAASASQGKKSYEQVCGLCHGVDGLGKPGQAPPLSGSEWVNAKGHNRLAHIPLAGISGTLSVAGRWSRANLGLEQ